MLIYEFCMLVVSGVLVKMNRRIFGCENLIKYIVCKSDDEGI